MWHGPALAEVLDGVDAAGARARPIAGAHSIWEIVLHITSWADIARQRIHGEATGDPPPEQDWPPVPAADADWSATLDRLRDSHIGLLRAAYDALHQLVMAAWYGNPRAWPAIGYPGPPELGTRERTS